MVNSEHLAHRDNPQAVAGEDGRVASTWSAAVAQTVKNLPAMQETRIWSLDWEDPLQKWMAAHSSILAWRIPWTEEPGRLQSVGSQRVRHDWVTSTTTSASWCAQGKDRQGPCEMRWLRAGGDSSQRALNGVGTLSILVRAGLPGSLGKHTWLSAGGGNHLPFLPVWSCLALGSWMNKSISVRWVFTVWKQPYGLAFLSAPLGSDGINFELVGAFFFFYRLWSLTTALKGHT